MKTGLGVPPRLVVFDLDGTLVDSLGDLSASANQALVEAYGERARLSIEVVRGFVGRGARYLVEGCVGVVGGKPSEVSAVFDRFLLIYGSRLTETTRLYPGVSEALDRLASSSSLAVLTNKPGLMSRAIVRDLGVAARFIAVIGGDDLNTRKPDPEGLLHIAAQVGVSPRETAMVGDSAVDMLTARNAGAIAVGALWGYDREGVIREKPDLLAETPRALLSDL